MRIPKGWYVPHYQTYEFRKKKTKYCICIPVINEGEKIQKQLQKMLPSSKIADIIIADWGSTDNSTDKILLENTNVKTLLIKTKPFGRQSSQLRMGFAYALQQGYKGIIQMDGNNKDGTEGIIKFIQALDAGYDYIHGSRFIKDGKAINTPWIRWIGIRFIFSPMLSLAGKFWFTDITNGFRAYSSKYLLDRRVQPFRNLFNKYELLFYLPVRAGQLKLKIKEIPVTRRYPFNTHIPTKITGLKGHIDLFITAVKVALNLYNPTS